MIYLIDEINLGTVIDIYQSLIIYVNDLRIDEEYMHYSNITISISSENFMNTGLLENY